MTHTPSEWAAMFCIATSGYASFSVFYFLFVDADPCDFDPRPAVRRALETGRLVPVWRAAVDAGHTINRALATGQRVGHHAAEHVRRASLRAAISVAALLALLFPTTEVTQ